MKNIFLEKDTCNLKVGGHGGFDYINKNGLGMNSSKALYMLKCRKDKYSFDERSDIARAAARTSKERMVGFFNQKFHGSYGFKGKSHSESTKVLMKLKKRGYGSKESNTQFGTRWITNESENRKIKSSEKLPDGWRFGRTI